MYVLPAVAAPAVQPAGSAGVNEPESEEQLGAVTERR